MDINKTVQVLQDQIEKLNAKDFDLNAWKNFTILLLERIFGPGNQKIQSIQHIKYDQGSWVLRDETGYTNSIEACKKLGGKFLKRLSSKLKHSEHRKKQVMRLIFRLLLLQWRMS